MPKRFLVTGGCGFIGSHLVEFLVEQGNSVVIIDDLSSGYLSNLPDPDSLENLIHTRVEDLDLKKLGRFDGLFHLAAQASVPISIKDFYASSSTNILSSLRVIDYCASTNVPLVYASSSALYGNLPIGNELGGVDIISPYAADKLFSEVYCDLAYKLYGLRSYGLRFFNVYGPRQDPVNPYSGVISIFADRILKGQDIVVNGGYQTRDFIYVKDVVRGIWSSYKYLLKNPASTFSNLLPGKSISINELARQLILLTGNQVKTIYKELPMGDPEQSLGSIEIMRDKLKLVEFVNLDDGLRDVLRWMRKNNERS